MCTRPKVENFRYITDIFYIGTKRHEIGNRQSFEGKIEKKSGKSVIYRYQTDISVDVFESEEHARVGFFVSNYRRFIDDLSNISVIYRRYIR